MAYTAQQQYYANLTRQAAAKYGIDQNIAEVQIYTESRFNPNAQSPAGAKGIAQFMPGTAAQYGLTNPYDPVAALDAYGRHMRDLLNMFGWKYDLALAAYNAGAGNVQKYGGVPPFTETKNYVSKILSAAGMATGGGTPSISPTGGISLATQGITGGFLLGVGVLLFIFALRR